MKHKAAWRAALAVMVSLLALPAGVQATPPDATAPGVLIDTTDTYNLGPTGARGWIYSTGNEWLFTPEGLTTESRQILVTRVEAASPAAGILLAGDVMLGASGTAAAPVAFTSDARKSLGLAIAEAEKTANAGALKLLIWRGGLTLNVQITLAVMGSYSATAPFSCPKSANIITKACTRLASRSINSGYTEGNAVIALALLACVAPTDPYYATVQSKVQTYARQVAAQYLDLTIPVNAMVAWPWGYTNVFLSEYYLATDDAQVLPAIRELTATCAAGQSVFGTYGHGMAWSKSDGSSTHGHVPTYGPVNQAGETVNLGIMLGRKAIARSGGSLDPEIEPAIERGRKYFAYFAGKGSVPYGHSPPEDLHDDNGKNGLASLLMALQDQADMSPQAQYFAKSCTAAYSLREMGHTGPYYAHLWQPLGVNVGGPTAMAAYFRQIQWELDMVRRWDGSFAYHSATGASANATDPTKDAMGLGADSDTACFLLTYATALQRLYITGKNPNAANHLNASDVNEAITDGVYSLRTDLDTLTSDQLVAALSSWSSQKRNWAAAELATRADASTKVATLLTMAADLTNLNARKGACQALGQLKPATAVSVLRDRLSDSDYHVRYYAAEALKAMGSVAQPALTDMLTKIVATAQPIEPINWADPYQIAYGTLGGAAFEAQLGGSVSGVSTGLLYPAITAMSRSLGRNSLINTFNNALTLPNVQALAPVITTALMSDHTICNEWLADACIRLLAKYNIDEGIPAAMIFENLESGRSWLPNGNNDCKNALKKYGSTAAATLPSLDYWNGNGYDLADTIATIQNDTTAHTLVYFKSISTCTATPTTVTLPLGTALLSAAAADIDGNGASLVYSWSKPRGAGAVTFSTNGTTTSNTTLATFDTPGSYIVRLGVTDGVLDPNKYGPVTRDLTLTVVADPNRPPVALNQHVSTALDTAKAITLTATDADAGNPLTYTVVTGPASGTLAGTPPALTYTPVAGFTGNTGFTFKANDGKVDSSIATVTIAVGLGGNITPVAHNQSVSTAEDTAKIITLTGTDADGNPLTYSIVDSPAHGTLAGTAASRTYTPAANYYGTDSFTFVANDGTVNSALATVVINVTAVNDAPLAIAQTLSTVEDTAIPITLAGTDPEGYAITYKLTAAPTHGTLSGVVPFLTYTPAPLYNGSDSLAFTVTDSEGVSSAAATVSLTVTPVNQAPVALNRSLPVALGTATAIVLSGTDADNNPLTFTVLSQPAHGTLRGTAPNLTFTPVAGYNSTDSFTFKVNDGTVDSALATVFLSMGTISPGIHSEFYQQPPDLYTWPDMAHLAPNDTRIDPQISFAHADFPTGYEDHFSSRHTGYVKITTAGYYAFSISADDNTRVFVDETWVMKTIYGQAGWSNMPVYLTAGYHGIRVEFVETYGDNYLYLDWSGPGASGRVPASAFFRCVGSTAPVVPANLTATPLDSAVALAWSLSPFATSYTVQRATAPGGPYASFPDVTTTNYRDATVTNGTTYYYVVTATGAGGTSLASNEASAMPVTAPVTVNLDYHGSAILMNGTASNSAASSGTASRVAPLDYDGINAASTAVHCWNAGAGGTTALTNMKNSEGVATTIGVSAILVAHGSASDWGGLGVAPNGARLLKGGLQLSQSPNLLSHTTLFKVTGLNTSHIYQLALASQYNTDDRSTSYRVGLVQHTVENGGTATDWRAGANHAVLDRLIPNAAGEIHVQAKVNNDWAPLNGWQLLDKGVRAAGTNTYTTIDTCTFGALGAAQITDRNITITVPFGTAISALSPTLVAAAGATIAPATPQNFASPVTYRVTAENGGIYQDYTVTITVAPNVVFTNTALAVTAAATGAEILSTGTLVEANHFGSTAVAPVTLANGLSFGTDWSHTSPTGLSASHQRTDTDTHGHVPSLNGSTAFGKLMRSYAWSSETYHYLNLPGLTPGHTYRLQLVSTDGASAGVSVEQALAPSSWSGNNRILTASWTQNPGDYVANVVLTRTGSPEMETSAYALHDVTPGFQPSPTGLVATAGDGQIALSWDPAPGATGYTVKRATITGGPYAVIANPTGTTYLNPGLTNGTRYYYVISAITALGETPHSAQASALPTVPASPPAAPTGLAATPGSNTVGLTWNASSGALGYNVKRSLTSGGPYTTLGSPAATSYIDATAINGTPYHYVVSATNGAGEGANSTQVSATPSALPSTTTLASSLGATGAYGSAVTFTATVTAGASGTVTFKDGATVLGTGTLSSGQASIATSSLALGGHSITASYGGDATYAPSASGAFDFTVSAKMLTITGVTAANKIYDATATATLTGGAVSGVVSGESVTVIAGTGAFASANVGTWPVTATGYALGGANAGNYALAAQPGVANAGITARPLQLAGTRVYDGTLVAAAASLTIQNNLDGANLTLTGSTTLAGKEVGAQALAPIPAAARVQSKTGNTGPNASTTIPVTLSTAPANGNTLIAVIATRGSSAGRVTGITQTGATWSRAAQATNPNGTTTEIWQAPNILNAAAALTINQALLRSAAVVMEYRGVLSASPLDQTSSATGNSTAALTGTTPSTTQANELWIGGMGYISSTPTLGTVLNSFTAVASAQSTHGTAANNAKGYALERIVSATGTAYSGGTLSTTAQWAGALATFKTITPGTLALAGSAAGNYTLTGATGSLQVTPKALTVNGLAASDKTYDGTPAVALTGSAALPPAQAAGSGTSSDGKPYTGDTLTLGGTAVAEFADKHAGPNRPVTVTGITLGGAQAGNYTLTRQVGLTANLTPRPLTVAAVPATKTYDGTSTAAGTPILTPPLATGDAASTLAQAFQDGNAGDGNKVIIPGITLDDGNGGANYAVTLTNCTTGTIHQAAASITLGDLTQTYDGTPKSASATTTPEGLTVNLTYDGSPTSPSAAGSYAVLATIREMNHTGTASGTLLIKVEDLDSWRASHFTPAEITAGLAADDRDPDGDGFGNLAEYTLGTDPRTFNPHPLALTHPAGNTFTLRFVARSASGAGYAGRTRKYAVEVSSDLANPASWQGLSGFTNLIGEDQSVIVTLPIEAPGKFYRLNVRVE
ncbi:MAG: DUF6288 domain-containing protein [Verrucomicrobia bacterium]|nr:DUF6288 domain-containing protein [Verrucomicrobiota bacterium]